MTLIMKFGGTSVGDGGRIKSVAGIVSKAAKKDKVAVVVSAMAGVTDSLLKAAESAQKSSEHDIDNFVRELRKRHMEAVDFAVRKKKESIRKAIDERSDELKKELLKIRKSGLTQQGKDAVAAFGEKMSAAILSGALSDLAPSEWYHGDDRLIITNDNYVNAEPDMEATEAEVRKRISPQMEKGIIPVVTGFMGSTPEGRTTTLGRGSSDHIASILGACLDASEVQIWTDVDGLLTADPKVVSNAKLLDTVSFKEARELAYFGAKVIHPQTMLPAMRKGIPIRILNTHNLGSRGTLIMKEGGRQEGVVKALTAKKGVTLIDVVSSRMLAAHGFLAKLFDVFSRYSISVDMVSTTEVSVSMTVDNGLNGKLDSVVKDLKEISSVRLLEDRALICVVGEGIRHIPGIAGRAFSRLGASGINVECISQGASEISISFVVKNSDADRAVRLLHDEFFPEVSG